ncbi:hypothetical protein SAMN05216573_13512 [Bradyrhizobium sp. Rc3b]|uniref:hypothetical protein n=1 Tax=Bradyrhizobium sp. Rc3b TaxID=1855322 RepID=UPI0008ED565F|nr:hypothetical protein [Bradyrhizobium sp. Rc3b]SFN96984.1 hypothetical protein SAMN05216573_13512 [Bradyrhizobium sp. Rc3b]
MSASSMRSLAKKRKAALVFAQSWQANGISAHAVTNLLQLLAKSLTKTGILENCLVDLALCPVFDDTFITIILAT